MRQAKNSKINKNSVSINIENGVPTEINSFVYSHVYKKKYDNFEYNYSLNSEIPDDNYITDINNKEGFETNAAFFRNINVSDGTISDNIGVSTETCNFVYNEGTNETKQYKPNLSNNKNDYKIKEGSFFSVNAEQYNGTNDIVVIRNL